MPEPQPSAVTAPAALVWGLGTGRHLRPLLSRGPVLVLAIDVPASEPLALDVRLAHYPEVLAAARDGRVHVVHGPPQELARAFRSCPSAALHVHLPALDAAPAEAGPLARLVARVHAEQREAARHRRRLSANLDRNAPLVAAAAPLSALAGTARGRVALVLAAGPSLPASLPHLAAEWPRGPVIAVDTTLPILRRAGLSPHLVATVDPHPSSARHLSEGVPGGALCAFQPYACPEVVAAFERHVVAAPAGDLLWERLAPALDLPTLPTAGTVLLFALQLAEIMGAHAVVVAGADLAPLGSWSHAPGTAHATREIATTARTVDSQGRALATTRALRQFQDAVETHVGRSPIPHLFVDGGGAAIRGATMVPAARVAAALPTPTTRTAWSPPAVASSPRAPERLAAITRIRAQFDSHAPQTHDGSP